MFVISRCRKYIPGWSLKGFKQEALDLYEQTCLDLARGDYDALRNVCPPPSPFALHAGFGLQPMLFSHRKI